MKSEDQKRHLMRTDIARNGGGPCLWTGGHGRTSPTYRRNRGVIIGSYSYEATFQRLVVDLEPIKCAVIRPIVAE